MIPDWRFTDTTSRPYLFMRTSPTSQPGLRSEEFVHTFTPINHLPTSSPTHHSNLAGKVLSSKPHHLSMPSNQRKNPRPSTISTMSLESEQSLPTPSDEPEPKRQARDNEVQGIEVPEVPYTIMVYIEGGPVGSAIVTSQKNAPTRQNFLNWPVYYQSFN